MIPSPPMSWTMDKNKHHVYEAVNASIDQNDMVGDISRSLCCVPVYNNWIGVQLLVDHLKQVDASQ